ncbi:MAG: hypothetical protein PUH41_02335 [Prevotella sp.]|nr:hypothetical protein [Prevotella sp.]
MTIQIFNRKGEVAYTVPVGDSSTYNWKLQSEEYISVAFSAGSVLQVKKGFYTDIEGLGRFEIVSLPEPTASTKGDGYEYELRMDRPWAKFKNRIIYLQRGGVLGMESRWSLTDTIENHCSVLSDNLTKCGFNYKGDFYHVAIHDGVDIEKSKLIEYDATSLLDALGKIAEAFECEWWIVEDTIHFGRCETDGNEITLTMHDEIASLSRSEDSNQHGTRLYAFGSSRNLNQNYRRRLKNPFTVYGWKSMYDSKAIIKTDKPKTWYSANGVLEFKAGVYEGQRFPFTVIQGTYTEGVWMNPTFEVELPAIADNPGIAAGDKVQFIIGDVTASQTEDSTAAVTVVSRATFSCFSFQDLKLPRKAVNSRTTLTLSDGTGEKNITFIGVVTSEDGKTTLNDGRDFYRFTDGSSPKTAIEQKATLAHASMMYVNKLYTEPIDGQAEVKVQSYSDNVLQLPVGTPYIDSPGIDDDDEIVEVREQNEDIYPRALLTIDSITTVDAKETDEDTGEVSYWKAYRFTAKKQDGTPFHFDNSYLINEEDKPLSIHFESGKLSGLEFEVHFNPEDKAGENRMFEITRNNNYQLDLPNEIACPQKGDTLYMFNMDADIIDDELVTVAEQELKTWAEKEMMKICRDSGTYTATINPVEWGRKKLGMLQYGQKVKLNAQHLVHTSDGTRSSRIIAWELKLHDITQGEYTIGESSAYSSSQQLSNDVQELIYWNGQIKDPQTGNVSIRLYDKLITKLQSRADNLEKQVQTKLSKTHDDSTPHKLTMGAAEVKGDATIKGDAIIGKDGFAGGLTGFGTRLGKDGMIEADGLSLRRFLEVPELRYNRVEVYVGNQWRAPGAGIIESVTPDTNNDGTEAATGEIKLKLEEGEIGKVAVDDICMGIFHDHVAGSNATEDSDDGKGGFKFSGFYTCYFRITEITEKTHNSAFKYELREFPDGSHSRHPSVAMHFVCYGNFTNPSRQTCRYSTLTYERYLAGVDSWTFGKGNIRAQFGDLSNLSMFGLNMSGYSAYINNVYLDGHLVQLGDGGIDGITPYTYSVDNIADTVPVDALGNLKQELVATQADGSKEWLLHCSITVRKGQKLLTCAETSGGNMSGKYALTMVCDGCTAHFDHSTLLVDTVDYRNRKTASVEVTMDCEGRAALTMQFTIKVVADGQKGDSGTEHGYDHAYGISAKLSTATPMTAPDDVGSWSQSPLATTSARPYLWLRETPWSREAGGDKEAGQPTYMRLTGQKGDDGVPGKDGNSWRMRGRAEAWYRTQSDFDADTRTWENGQVALIDKSGDSYHFAQMLQGKTALRDGVWVGVSSDEGDAYTIGSHIYMAVEDRWLDLGEFAGERGQQGEPGANGRTVRIYKSLEAGRTYYGGDTVTPDGFCYLDYYAVRNDDVATGWDMFRCRKTYTHAANMTTEEHWEKIAVNANDAFFQTLIAKNARIEFMTGTQISVLDGKGKQYAGLGGYFPLWVGEHHDYPGVTGDNYSAYTFTVSKDGTLYSKNAYIEGNVTATTGKIAGFNINGDTLEGRNDFRKSVVTLSPGKIDLTTEADGNNGYIRRKFVADSASSNIVAAIGYKVSSAQSPHTYFAALQLKAEGGAEVALDILSGVLRGVRLETATVESSCTIMPSDDATNQTGMVARGILYVRTGALVMVGDSNGTDTTITLPNNPPDGSNYTLMGLTERNYHLLPGTSGQTVHSVNDGKEWAEITVKAGCMAFLVAKGGKWYCRIFY